VVGKPRVFAKDLHHIPDGLALDADQNLYVTCYGSHNVYRVSPKGKVSLFAHDLSGTMIASPTNAAFGSDGYIYFANLSRWHICRVHVGTKGQPLANQRVGSRKS
jgi:sugar lactone lactonase YvrE